jgi:hypothetical protein
MKLQALTTALFLSCLALSEAVGISARAQPQQRQGLGRSLGRQLPYQHQSPHHSHREAAASAAAARRDNNSAGPPPSSRSTGGAAPMTATGNPASTPAPAPTAPQSPSLSSASSVAPATGSASAVTTTTATVMTIPTPVVSVPQGANGAPPLSLISSGMSTGVPSPVVSTYAPGATPPISGVPPLPTPCTSLIRVISPFFVFVLFVVFCCIASYSSFFWGGFFCSCV